MWSVCCRSGLRLWSGQFVVGVDGAVGITYEHCAAEGPPVIAIVDHTFTYWSVSTNVSKTTGHCNN